MRAWEDYGVKCGVLDGVDIVCRKKKLVKGMWGYVGVVSMLYKRIAPWDLCYVNKGESMNQWEVQPGGRMRLP